MVGSLSGGAVSRDSAAAIVCSFALSAVSAGTGGALPPFLPGRSTDLDRGGAGPLELDRPVSNSGRTADVGPYAGSGGPGRDSKMDAAGIFRFVSSVSGARF